MRVRILLTPFALIAAKQANAEDNDVDRAKILNLLSEIGADESHVDTMKDMWSLLQRGRFLWFRWGKDNENRRRVNGHAPCECPDTPGDQRSGGCLNRRLGYLSQIVSSVQTPNATTGFSIEGARMAVRSEFANLVNTAGITSNVTGEFVFNLTDPSNGFVPRLDRVSQKLLAEESLMVESLNNAWMSTVNVSDKVVAGANDLSEIISNSTGALIDWFNSLQDEEEKSNHENVQNAAAVAQSSLAVYVDSMNDALSMDDNALAQLGGSVGGSQDSSYALCDALESAADSLSGKIESFNQTLISLGQPTSQAIGQALDGLVNQYQQIAQQQLSVLQTTSASKIADMRNASSIQIHDQDASAIDSIGLARNTSNSQVSELRADQGALTSEIQSQFRNLSNYINEAGQNYTASLQRSVGAFQDNRTAITNSERDFTGQLGSFNSSEKKIFTSAQTDVQGNDAQAGQSVNSLFAKATGRQTQVQTKALNVAAGSVQGVGSNFQSNMQSMGLSTDSLISTLTSSAGSTAQDSANAANGLSLAATSGQQAISTAGQTVQGSFQSSFGDVLDQMGSIPGTIGASTQSSTAMMAAINQANTNASTVALQVSVAANDGLESSASNLSIAESVAGALASNVTQDAPAAEATIDSIESSVGSSSATSNGASANANQVANTNSQALSDAASLIADNEDGAATALQSSVSQLMQSGGDASSSTSAPLSSGLSEAMASAGSLVQSAKNAIDQSSESISSGGQSAVQSLEDAQGSSARASGAAQSDYDQSAVAVDRGAHSALADVNQYLATSTGSTSDVVSQQMNSVKSKQNEASLQMGQLSASQLTQIQSVASSIDSLMQQMNGYMGKNSGPLAKDIAGLAADANNLFLQLNVLQSEASDIETEAETSTGQDSWSGPLSAFQTVIVSQNSSAMDQLSQIESQFNESAGDVSASVHSQISDSVNEFADSASSLESQLGGIQLHATNIDAEHGAQLTIGAISNLADSMSNLTNQSMRSLSKVSNSTVDTLPSNISDLYGLVTVGMQAAGVDSQYASSLLDQLAAEAKAQVNSVSQFNQTDGFLNPGEISQQASMSKINENVAKTKLQQQQAFLKDLSGTSTDLSSDYQAQVQATRLEASQDASNVYNKVVQGKAHVSQMVGNIAAQYAAQQTQMGSNTTLSNAQQSIDIATLRRNMAGLINVFDSFTGAANQSFSTGANDMETFGVATLAQLKRRLSALDQQLLNDDQQIGSNISDINTALQGVNVTDIDAQAQAAGEQFDDWMQAQVSSINSSHSALSSVGSGTPMNESTLDMRTNGTVNSLAQAAQALLAQYGIDNSRIDQIIAQTTWNGKAINATASNSSQALANSTSNSPGATGSTSNAQGLAGNTSNAPQGNPK